MPQLEASVCTLVQTPLQLSGVAPLQATHAPAVHCSPLPQALAHMPQFSGSVCVSTQVPPQSVIPGHAPPVPVLDVVLLVVLLVVDDVVLLVVVDEVVLLVVDIPPWPPVPPLIPSPPQP
jgi:hypothetical protein